MQNSLIFNMAFNCITCNKDVSMLIANSFLFPDVLVYLCSFIVVAVTAGFFYYLSVKKLKYYRFANPYATLLNPIPLTFAGVVLGMGIGGFIDGIIFHQVLQWHGMLTNKIPPDTLNTKNLNMFWDGLFHAFMLVIVAAGLHALWKTSRYNYTEKSGSVLVGGMLCGWAVFNIVEGLINHHLLKLHNVRENASSDYYNYAFILLSVLLLLLGSIILSGYYKNILNLIKYKNNGIKKSNTSPQSLS